MMCEQVYLFEASRRLDRIPTDLEERGERNWHWLQVWLYAPRPLDCTATAFLEGA